MTLVAAVVVSTGVWLIVIGGDRSIARSLLIVGLVYALASIVLERRERRR
jgi:hypothetical protein